MTKAKIITHLLLSAILLAASWPVYGFSPLLFIGFVPLLLVEKEVISHPDKYKVSHLFIYAFLCFVLWNLSVSWWVYFASGSGAVMAVLFNASLMTMVFTIAHIVKKKLIHFFKSAFSQRLLNYNLIFVVSWLAFEYLHHNWDLSYPWLTLGNGLATDYKYIQWYEYTGVLGGSLWILLTNVIITNAVTQTTIQKKAILIKASLLLALVVLPMLFSIFLYNKQVVNKAQKTTVVVVQPNIDPYNEKFSGTYIEQLNKMLLLGKSLLDSTTDYLVFPETALTENIWENNLHYVKSIQEIQAFLKQYPHLTIVIGASTAKAYETNETPTETAQKFKDGDAYYDNFNTAFQLDTTGNVQIYHKSKLVPGVERMPFPALFKPLESFALDLGGTTGSLGTQQERAVFVSDKAVKVAPIICYESIYGEYVTGYVKNGAQALFIITNDGWWRDTPGYKQHLVYGRLRAIENRRSVARSANTGTSCFMNERGDIEQATNWWQPAAIKGTINLNNELTFYAKHGDFIGRIALYTTTVFLLLALSLKLFIAKKS